MLRPFVEQVARYRHGGGEGMSIKDAFSGEMVKVFLHLAWCVVSTRGTCTIRLSVHTSDVRTRTPVVRLRTTVA